MILHPVIIAVSQKAAARTPEQVQAQRQTARQALRRCALLCNAPEEGWQKDAGERPLPLEGFRWSVAHKRKWAAAVIADHPVGIDIEHLAPRREEMFDELAGAGEWDLLGGRAWPAFFRVWTAKEAVMKAVGVGIAGFRTGNVVEVPSDRRLTIEYGGRFWQVEHYYHDNHVTAVTTEANPVTWHVVG